MTTNPVPRKASACAVVLDERGTLLLHRRSDNGNWGLPGGGIESDETAAEAVVREVHEETGYRVEVERLIGIYSDPAFTTMTYPDGNRVAYVALAFACRLVGGAPALSDETTAVDWWPTAALPESVSAGHRQRIADALDDPARVFVR